MANLNDCNQESIEQEHDHKEKKNIIINCTSKTSNLILTNQQQLQPNKIELIAGDASNQTTFKTLNSTHFQSNKAELNENSKLISIGSVNGTKLTGKLVAVRKDGNSYTFTTTNTTSSTNSTGLASTKTFTIATPSKGNTSLITVSSKSPNLTLTNNSNNKANTLITSTPQRFYFKTTTANTIETNSSTSLQNATTTTTKNSITQSTIQGDSTSKINTSKPIILQMKRKIQVLNDENRKTARIFTIPTSNLINKQTNQFIVMNRSLLKPNLVTNNLIKTINTKSSNSKPIQNTSIHQLPIIDTVSLTNKSLSISSPANVKIEETENSIDNYQQQQQISTIRKLKTSSLITSTATKTNETSAQSNVSSSKQILLNNNSIDNKLENEMILNEVKINLDSNLEHNSSSQTEQSAGDQLRIEKNLCSINKNNLLNKNCLKNCKDSANLFIDDNLSRIREEIIENCIENDHIDCLENEIENLIETTIENSLDKTSSSFSNYKTTENNLNQKLVKIEQDDIEFYPTIDIKEEVNVEENVSLNTNNSLTTNDCLPQFSMQNDSKPDSLDNLIMDECAAAMVLMSLSFSPKNNYNEANLHSPSLISQKVVFQCTWRNYQKDGNYQNCGKESESREDIEHHVRQHLGISSSNGDHEEDFYYTEIDVYDSNTQDSSGVSSADSPDQIANCCGEPIEFCDCKSSLKNKIKQEKLDQNYDDGLFDQERLFNSQKISLKLQDVITDRLNKKQQRKSYNNKIRSKNTINNKKTNSATNLIWNKKGLLKCNGTFEMKRNRVGRPRRLKINCSQPLSIQTININNSTINSNRCNLKKSIKQEQTLLRTGLEWSVRRSASSPINIPGISIAHQNYSNENNNDLLDISYNSDQFKVGSICSNVGILEKCMAKQEQLKQSQNSKHHHSYEFMSSYSSTSSSGVAASIASSSSTTSSSPSSPSLQSSYSTIDHDTDYWLFINGEKQNNVDDYDNDSKFNNNGDLCKRNSSLFTSQNYSIRKHPINSNLKTPSKHSKEQQENTLPTSRSVRQTVNLINQPNVNNLNKTQKSAGYYASLHRGIIQPPNLQQFAYSNHTNSTVQSNNVQTAQNNNTTTNGKSSSNNKNQVRRSRNISGSSSGMKCRRLYGMANKHQWCLQCKWKKRCSRVDSNTNSSLVMSEELSTSPTFVRNNYTTPETTAVH